MFRTFMIGVAMVAALAAYSPMDAFARGGHGGGGFHGGGFSGGGFRGGSFAAMPGGGMRMGGGFSGARMTATPGARFAGVSGAGFRGGHFRHHHHFRSFAPFAIGFGAPYFYDDYYYAGYPYDDCYQPMRVPTRYGWRWRRVYVCG